MNAGVIMRTAARDSASGLDCSCESSGAIRHAQGLVMRGNTSIPADAQDDEEKLFHASAVISLCCTHAFICSVTLGVIV